MRCCGHSIDEGNLFEILVDQTSARIARDGRAFVGADIVHQRVLPSQRAYLMQKQTIGSMASIVKRSKFASRLNLMARVHFQPSIMVPGEAPRLLAYILRISSPIAFRGQMNQDLSILKGSCTAPEVICCVVLSRNYFFYSFCYRPGVNNTG